MNVFGIEMSLIESPNTNVRVIEKDPNMWLETSKIFLSHEAKLTALCPMDAPSIGA